MGVEHPYLAILALIMFTAGVIGAVYLYIHIYSETLKVPVLSASAISCYNDTSTILSIIIKHERGDMIELQKIQITSDIGLIDVTIGKEYQDIYVEMINFNKVLYPGQIGRITITLKRNMYTENETYHAILYFDKTTATTSFRTISCRKLMLHSPEAWYLLYTSAPPIALKYPLEIDINRASRTAITYTDFETYPVPEWTSHGGMWGLVSGVVRAKGNVIRGIDDDKGLGRASYYYYSADLSGYSSLWIVAKTKVDNGSGRYGIAMISISGVDRVFTVVVNTTGYLEIWDYNVIPPARRWTRHAQVAIPNYNINSWYILVASYTVSGSTISITVHLYDVDGGYINSVSASISHARVFIPAHLGVIADGITAYFDDFIISTSDPRSIRLLFTNPYDGIVIEIIDNIGNIVVSGIASSNVLNLDVVKDVVIGTGINGKIRLLYGAVEELREFDVILGGDIYNISVIGDVKAVKHIHKFVVGVNNLFTYISLSMNSYVNNLYIVCLKGYTIVRLKLIDYTNLTNYLNLSISLIDSTVEDSQKIEIMGSNIKSNSTSLTNITGRGYIVINGIALKDVTLYLLLECYSSTNLDKPITHIPIVLELNVT